MNNKCALIANIIITKFIIIMMHLKVTSFNGIFYITPTLLIYLNYHYLIILIIIIIMPFLDLSLSTKLSSSFIINPNSSKGLALRTW